MQKGSKIANTIPFKKVLEALAYYNPKTDIPILLYRILPDRKLQPFFLLSSDENQPTQLIVSVFKENNNKIFTFVGNAYSWWMNNNSDGPPVCAQESIELLENTMSNIDKDISRKVVEFAACTHIAESHFTPGNLAQSRVPGSSKLARSILREHLTNNKPLASSFAAKEKTPYPLAAQGGTGNMRKAVDALLRNEGTRPENSPANDMSDDSDVEMPEQPSARTP